MLEESSDDEETDPPPPRNFEILPPQLPASTSIAGNKLPKIEIGAETVSNATQLRFPQQQQTALKSYLSNNKSSSILNSGSAMTADTKPLQQLNYNLQKSGVIPSSATTTSSSSSPPNSYDCTSVKVESVGGSEQLSPEDLEGCGLSSSIVKSPTGLTKVKIPVYGSVSTTLSRKNSMQAVTKSNNSLFGTANNNMTSASNTKIINTITDIFPVNPSSIDVAEIKVKI